MESKVEVSLELIEKIRKRLENLRVYSKDKYTKDELQKVINAINFNILNLEQNIDEVRDVINSEMKRLKYLDEDLYLKLYILEQDLLKGKITIIQALEFLKNYTTMGEELFNKFSKFNKEI